MSDQPKVSERMAALLLEVVLDVRAHEQNGNRYTFADYEESRSALLSAIAEIEQRAEKWKAVALAHVALMQSMSGSVDEINAASKKTVDACNALGDEWDEAVR